jgi:hypothetical protein
MHKNHKNLQLIRVAKVVAIATLGVATSNALAIPLEIGLSWSGGNRDPLYDSTLYRHTSVSDEPTLYLDIDGFSSLYPHWSDLSLENATASTKPTLTLNTFYVDPNCSFCGGLNQKTFSIDLESLSITDLAVESQRVRFRFLGSNNRLILNNADLKFDYLPEFSALAPLTIEFASGESTIRNWNQKRKFEDANIGAPTTLTVAPGATARFLAAGTQNTNDITQALRLTGPSTIDIDGGTLTFEESFFRQENGTTTLRNGGRLNVKTSGTSVYLDKVNVTGLSTLSVTATGESFQAKSLNLDSSTLESTSGTIRIEDVTASGDVLFQGMATASVLDFDTLILDSSNPTHIFLFDIGNMKTSGFASYANSNVTLTNSNLTIFDLALIQGSTFNLTGTSDLRLFGKNDAMTGNFNFAAGSSLVIGETSILELSPSLNLNFSANSKLNVEGALSGSYDLGEADLNFQAENEKAKDPVLSPGALIRQDPFGQRRFGQIVTNGDIFLTGPVPVSDPGLASTGLFDGSVYVADVGVSGGIASNDELVYNSGTVDLSLMKHVYVRSTGNTNANDFLGQEFTIVRSQDAASTGGIFYNGQTVDIVEDGSVLAIVDFVVADRRTNGKDDLTLVADVNIKNLAKNPSVSGKNRGSAASFLINASNSGNAGISSLLSTLTNAQVATHLDSIHAEPYSSYMTISLEHSDMIMNTVLNHAARDGVFSTGRSYEAVLPRTGNFYLASTGGEETVGDVVQAHSLTANHDRFWVDASYNEGDVDGDGELGDFEYSLQSLTIGQDLMTRNDRTIGAFFSIGSQDMDEHDAATQDFEGNNYYLGLYLNEADVGGWDLRGVLGYAFGDHDSRRTVVLSNSIATPTAGFNSHSVYAGVKGTVVGYQNDWVTLSPELGLSYTYYKQKSLTESGDPNLSLAVDSADAHAIIASAGANARFASLSETSSIYPLAFVHYEFDAYADDNNEHEIDAALVAHPEYRQTFVGQNRGEHAVTIGLGLGSDPTSTLQIRGGVKYTAHSHGDEWGAGVNLQYFW